MREKTIWSFKERQIMQAVTLRLSDTGGLLTDCMKKSLFSQELGAAGL